MKKTFIALFLFLSMGGYAIAGHTQDFNESDPPNVKKKEVELVKGKLGLKDSFFKRIGSIYMSLELEDDKITVLNVGFKVIFKKPCPTPIQDLIDGKPRPVYFTDGADVSLQINPAPGFSADGGAFDLDIFTATGQYTEHLIIAKKKNRFRVYKGSVTDDNELTNLSVILDGKITSPSTLKIDSYVMDTKK